MSYRYRHRDLLPSAPGIYRLQERSFFRWADIYVGKSVNVRSRWGREGDRRHAHLTRWRRNRSTMRLTVRRCWPCNLDYREAKAIQRLNPTLNKLRPKPRWGLLVLAEDLWRGLPWAGAIAVIGWATINA